MEAIEHEKTEEWTFNNEIRHIHIYGDVRGKDDCY